MKRKIRSKRILSSEKIEAIQKMFDGLAVDDGDSDNVIYSIIAKKYNISKSTVRSIIKKDGYYK